MSEDKITTLRVRTSTRDRLNKAKSSLSVDEYLDRILPTEQEMIELDELTEKVNNTRRSLEDNSKQRILDEQKTYFTVP